MKSNKAIQNTTNNVGIVSVTFARWLSDYAISNTELQRHGIIIADSDGARTDLTPLEIRVLYSLGLPLYRAMHDKETHSMIENYVSQFYDFLGAERCNINAHIFRKQDTRVKLTPVVLNVDLMELSSTLNYESSVRGILGKKTDDMGLYSIIKRLAQKRYVVRFTDRKGVTTICKVPLIYLTGKEFIQIKNDNRSSIVNVEELSEGVAETRRIRISKFQIEVGFGEVFLNSILTRFAYFPESLFKVWGRKGSSTDTEVFRTLLSLLLAQYHLKYVTCINCKKKVTQAIKERYNEKCKAFDEELKREILLIENEPYTESLDKLKSRLSVNYDRNATTRQRFNKDLENALKVLKDIGLVRRYGFGYSDDATVIMRKYGDTYKRVIKAKKSYLAVLLNPDYCRNIIDKLA